MGISYVDSVPRIDIEIPLGGGYRAKPNEPLNVVTHELGDDQPKVTWFERQLQSYVENQGQQDFISTVREEANFRNRLLYANDEGISVVSDVDTELIRRGHSVSVLLGLTICVLQTPAPQLFAIQVLEAFLASLNALPDEVFDFDGALRP